MRKRISRDAIKRAREHRARLPDAEGLLWWKLRELNRYGRHFRRQVPFRGYYLDFVEHGANVVVELDGDQHGLAEQRQHDSIRDEVLSREGYLVLRFPNHEVFGDLDRVVDVIWRTISERHPPTRNASAALQRFDLPTRGR